MSRKYPPMFTPVPRPDPYDAQYQRIRDHDATRKHFGNRLITQFPKAEEDEEDHCLPEMSEQQQPEAKVERKLKLPPITDAASANLQLKEAMAQRINTAIGSATMQLSRTATIHCAKERDANELRDFMLRYTKYVPAIKEKQYDEKAHVSERYFADTTPFAVVFEIPEVPEEELVAQQDAADAEEKKRMSAYRGGAGITPLFPYTQQ